MDLHLDDRLLHGRILHGWLPGLGPRRIILVAGGLAGSAAAASYAEAAAELGAALLCCDPDDGEALPPVAAGDFWLAGSSAACTALRAAQPALARLVIIGLRDVGGRPLAPDFAPAVTSLAALRRLEAGGMPVLVQRFPGEAPAPLATLLAAAGEP